MDANQRGRKPAVLQSAPIGLSGTLPSSLKMVCMVGYDPTTSRVQGGRATRLRYIQKLVGAGGGTRTPTIARRNLNPVRLPTPPRPQSLVRTPGACFLARRSFKTRAATCASPAVGVIGRFRTDDIRGHIPALYR